VTSYKVASYKLHVARAVASSKSPLSLGTLYLLLVSSLPLSTWKLSRAIGLVLSVDTGPVLKREDIPCMGCYQKDYLLTFICVYSCSLVVQEKRENHGCTRIDTN